MIGYHASLDHNQLAAAFIGFQRARRVKEHVRRHGIKQAVAVLSLGGPRAASLNDAVEDLVKV